MQMAMVMRQLSALMQAAHLLVKSHFLLGQLLL